MKKFRQEFKVAGLKIEIMSGWAIGFAVGVDYSSFIILLPFFVIEIKKS